MTIFLQGDRSQLDFLGPSEFNASERDGENGGLYQESKKRAIEKNGRP